MKRQAENQDPQDTHPLWKRVLKVLLITLASLYLLILIAALLLQRYALFPREFVDAKPDAGKNVPGLESIWIETSEGRVEAWFLPAFHGGAPGPAVMYAHGNGELIDWWPGRMNRYRQMGISVLLVEYRGYGRCAGDPSQDAIVADYVAFYDGLKDDPRVDAEKIFFHGRSLGGGVVGALARERQPAALILESTFTSVRAMARRFFLPGFLVRDPFDTEETLETYSGPVLILHGTDDSLIPYEQAEALHRTAARSTLVARSCEHNNCKQDGFYWESVESFLTGADILEHAKPRSGTGHAK